MNIVTLNMWGTSGPFEERWNFFIEELKRLKPKLLCLQEVWDGNLPERIKKTLNLPYSASSYESGLVLLAQDPIVSHWISTYRARSVLEDYDRRALIVRLKLGAQEVTVANTHLSWKPEDSETRSRQVDQLLHEVEVIGSPALLAGDFNDVPQSPAIQKIVRAGYQDLFQLIHPAEEGFTWDNTHPFVQTHEVKLPDRRIDFLFVDRTILKLHSVEACDIVFHRPNAKGVYPSDHYGLLARLRF